MASIDRLPKWAQEHINGLNRRINQLATELEVAVGEEPPDCNTWVHGTTRNDYAEKPLGRSVRIRFRTREGDMEAYVDLDGMLAVRGDTDIVVVPSATNSVNVLPLRVTR
jgi:hypothetical protein